MVRLEDDARARLQKAAIELFQQRGFDRTTAADIAALSGVTERTFFRHFADKREVLFDGQAVLSDALTAAIADAPHDLGPLDTLFHAFRSVQGLLEDNRPFSSPRHEIISSTTALRERELAKMAALAVVLATALKKRGVPDLHADLAALTGMAAFSHATLMWLEDPGMGLAARLDLAEGTLRALL